MTYFYSISDPSTWIERLKSWCSRILLKFIFPGGILYHPGQIRVLERCAISKAPFLFLPVHKSPFDAIVIKSVLATTPNRHDFRTFFVSRNTDIKVSPGFQMFPAHLWKKSDLMWAVQQSTVSSILSKQGHILAFLEPKVCSEGRPNLKLDSTILDHVFQSIWDEDVHDVQVVPVGISYDGEVVQKWPKSIWHWFKGKLIVQSVYPNLFLKYFGEEFTKIEINQQDIAKHVKALKCSAVFLFYFTLIQKLPYDRSE